jgi:mitosis inhibitor protein kinase SWE1
MVATFSPHRDAGGTLHLPSPTGMHHVDASSAIRQLRRSLSRSPSKSSDFRLLSSRTHSQTHNAPFISSPLSPSRRAHHGNLFFVTATTSNSSSTPVAIPYPPSAKINRPAMRRTGSLPNTRTRTSPKSPSKRVLNTSSDQGNATPVQPTVIVPGDENLVTKADVQESGSLFEHVLAPSENSSLAPKPCLARVEKRRSGNLAPISSTVSPLKRSDGIMNLDQASFESPSAKRRSLHGANSTSDFNIFDGTDSSQDGSPPREPLDGSIRNSEVQTFAVPHSPASPFATIPRRSSSLRRSTLQQRQSDRSFLARSRLLNGEYSDSPPTSPAAIMRHRMSLDSSLFIASGRESPFSPGHSLFSNQNGVGATPQAAHPLSRTITQSSSNSSLTDESPTHEPIHKGERPRAIFNFSKSLPAGATRPGAGRQFTREESNSSSDSFATPENYKLVKPLPAAFMSTGLISKKNRNAEDLQNPLGASKNMPDTPCKRSTNILPTAQKALPVRPIERPKLVRQSLAVSSTPFNPQHTLPASGPFARGTGIFGSVFNRPEVSSRRNSFVSVDGDEGSLSQSPSAGHENQSITESDLPPTPTKQGFSASHGLFPAGSGTLQVASLSRLSEPQGSTGEDSLWHRTYRAVARANLSTAGSLNSLNDNLDHPSPRTPKDSIFPPDPSRLSISALNDPSSGNEDFNASTLAFPATPTASRDYFAQSGKRLSLPLSGYNAPDVDSSLTTRFDKVELIGTGEFSQVYRVSKSQDASPYKSIFSLPTKGTNSPTALPERVWAVKKSKHPYAGVRDRERRLREVEILKTLANSDHVISFVDNWEDKGHLYIQTEFCEEGSLDVFLAQVGLKARLDDFRIWKILLELALVRFP